MRVINGQRRLAMPQRQQQPKTLIFMRLSGQMCACLQVAAVHRQLDALGGQQHALHGKGKYIPAVKIALNSKSAPHLYRLDHPGNMAMPKSAKNIVLSGC